MRKNTLIRFVPAIIGVILMVESCDKEYVTLDADGYKYVGVPTLYQHDGLTRMRGDGISCFLFSSGDLYTEATQALYEYHIEFKVFLRDSNYVNGAKIPLSASCYQKNWSKRFPEDFESITDTEACLQLSRTWTTHAVAKAYSSTYYEKSFIAIDGWVRIVGYTKHYGAEYECTVVAESDGETMKIRGEYELYEDR